MVGNKLVHSIRLDYASTSVADSAWVQIQDSLPANVRAIEVFDSGGYTMKLGYGPAGSELLAAFIPPGGNGKIECLLNQGMRLAVRCAVASTTVSAGELVINFYY